MIRTICLSILLFLFFDAQSQIQKQYIHQSWKFKHADSIQWHKAVVPGVIHTDLFNNDLIPDPFFGDNEKQLQWIESEEWVYETTFEIEKSQLNKEHIHLVFKGLDTYAKIILNGKVLGLASNMFVNYDYDVKPYIEKNNTLRVEFLPPLEQIGNLNQITQYPGGPQVYVRKAPFMFGWDWGPRYATMGIWQDVYLEFVENAKISDIYIQQSKINTDSANLNFQIKLNVIELGDYTVIIENKLKNISKKVKVEIQEKNISVDIPFVISEPKLWWPNGMGESFLYNFIVVLKKNNKVCDSKGISVGIKTIELINKKDSLGTSFYFQINGIPIFIKGANYIPQDIFINRLTDKDYDELLTDVKNSNMNMLRVWGGGIYEKDIFYELCDKYGILIWQDFMFAGSMYPGDKAFIANIQEEAIQQLKRLRNHPSIALWCGNNEISEGWHNWGWQTQMNYSAEDSAHIWHNYIKLFQEILPNTVSNYSPNTPYWESSPQYGRGNPKSTSNGDFHYWGVWHDAEPFENFNTKTGRFMSEYGFQSYPDIKTIAAFADSIYWQTDSEVMLTHQKHSRGNQLIKQYMFDTYGFVPSIFEDFIYLSQQTQAYGIEMGIKAQRRNMPYCMGTLYWQLNDCWPVVSWSSIDYYGRWKPLQYKVKNAYKPIIISTVKEGNILDIYIISDLLVDTLCELKSVLYSFDGEQRNIKTELLNIKANSSKKYASISIENIDSTQNFIELIISSTNKNIIISENIYLTKPKYFDLPKEDFRYHIAFNGKQAKITLSSNVLIKNIWISFSGIEHTNMSDNNFDLLPGQKKIINCEFKVKPTDKPLITFKTLNGILSK